LTLLEGQAKTKSKKKLKVPAHPSYCKVTSHFLSLMVFFFFSFFLLPDKHCRPSFCLEQFKMQVLAPNSSFDSSNGCTLQEQKSKRAETLQRKTFGNQKKRKERKASHTHAIKKKGRYSLRMDAMALSFILPLEATL
jgi:hypothetical protein